MGWREEVRKLDTIIDLWREVAIRHDSRLTALEAANARPACCKAVTKPRVRRYTTGLDTTPVSNSIGFFGGRYTVKLEIEGGELDPDKIRRAVNAFESHL